MDERIRITFWETENIIRFGLTAAAAQQYPDLHCLLADDVALSWKPISERSYEVTALIGFDRVIQEISKILIDEGFNLQVLAYHNDHRNSLFKKECDIMIEYGWPRSK